MTTGERLIQANDLASQRAAKYRGRHRVNKIAIALSLAAMAFGVFWLVWILWETLRLGVGGLSVALVTQMTRSSGSLPIPVTIVPGDMSKERLESIT